MPARERRHLDPGHRPLTARLVPPLLAGVLACAGPLHAQAQSDPGFPPAEAKDADKAPVRLEDRVTVTAARGDERVADTPASVAVLPRAALDATAALPVDDAMRQVVGFSLFRRSDRCTANPTTQGVSLRGVGASGASRG